jgi:hypothetical protein
LSDNRRPIETFEGRGETLAEALEDAATRAVEKDLANVGKQYVVLYHLVTVSNPRISEHVIGLGGGT